MICSLICILELKLETKTHTLPLLHTGPLSGLKLEKSELRADIKQSLNQLLGVLEEKCVFVEGASGELFLISNPSHVQTFCGSFLCCHCVFLMFKFPM